MPVRTGPEVPARASTTRIKTARILMAEFGVTISFFVAYRAKDDELATGERAQALADTMLAVLRGSPKVKAIQIECDGIEDVARLD